MTDIAPPSTPRRWTSRRRTVEFNLYFAVIFVLALPSASLAWARDVIRLRTLNLLGPLARAWAEADRTTPLIFSI